MKLLHDLCNELFEYMRETNTRRIDGEWVSVWFYHDGIRVEMDNETMHHYIHLPLFFDAKSKLALRFYAALFTEVKRRCLPL